MITHPFAATARGDVTLDEIADLLHEDVVYRSPLVARPVVGRDLLMEVLATAGEILKFEYVDEIAAGEATMLRWRAELDGGFLDGIDVVRLGEDGRVVQLEALLRPFPVVARFRDEMRRRLAARTPADLWDDTSETPLTAFID